MWKKSFGQASSELWLSKVSYILSSESLQSILSDLNLNVCI